MFLGVQHLFLTLQANILPLLTLYCTLSHEQVQVNLAVLHKAIDHAILLEDQNAQAGHETDGMAKKHQEIIGFEPEAGMNPILTSANLVFFND